MSRNFLLIAFTMIGLSSVGQSLYDNYILNFDDTSRYNHILIDSFSNPNNIWQLGVANKSVFSSVNNVMITDTQNPYPTNDTSIFIIKNVACCSGFVEAHTVTFNGLYSIQSDTITDFGMIEFSPNNGGTWINLLTDTAYFSYIDWTLKPVLTGNSGGWKNFYCRLAQLGPLLNIQNDDTILYRFTFISDSIQTNKDGLMFDDFEFMDFTEDIHELKSNFSLPTFPNPASNILSISIPMELLQSSKKYSLKIYNILGLLVQESDIPKAVYDKSSLSININDLKTGLFFIQIVDMENNDVSSSIFIKE